MGPIEGCIRCTTGRSDATASPTNFSNCTKPGFSSLFIAPIITGGLDGGMCCPFNQTGNVSAPCANGATEANSDNVCPSGRSSSGAMPFFNVVQPHKASGVVVGIGWSGQWSANLTKPAGSADLSIKAGMNHTHFVLHPGERVRTPSILMLHYKGDWVAGQNRFRQLIAKRYTPSNAQNRSWSLASGGSLTAPPFCYNESLAKTMASNIATIGSLEDGKFDTYWMDACWHEYQNYTLDKEQVWMPVPYQFPNGMKPVADAAHHAGMDFMLWFEPERLAMNYVQRVIAIADGQPAWNTTKLRRSADGQPWSLWAFHPDANLTISSQQVLLNYGNPDALSYMQKLMAKRINDWDVDIFRQDFNMAPWLNWNWNESDTRAGINEMKHIEGLYAFLDYLLEHKPTLVIDNCAGGGRRLDFEMFRRSVAFWTSDVNFQTPMMGAAQTIGLSLWYSKGGYGAMGGGLTNARAGFHGSSYLQLFDFCGADLGIKQVGNLAEGVDTGGVGFNFTSKSNTFLTDAAKIVQGYRSLAPFYDEGDFYPLTVLNKTHLVSEKQPWLGWQFHRTLQGDGVVHLLSAGGWGLTLPMAATALQREARYELTDWDNKGSPLVATGHDLVTKGLRHITKPGDFKVITYRLAPSSD